ncbi:LysR family transcriptional regulator [Enterovibrio norvegicus FF-33]|uniref:LysR family transcriptional regulator n=1 Tax=Enterovibrio norvegicus TaxID=188144 RepID=UPI0002DC10C7|nr:LysR family transcriptional regulator [Enterovibrio norvegicus]OEE67227.1 LysR family transcriptional regulator [Enterovibrio norvegicus FF-33]
MDIKLQQLKHFSLVAEQRGFRAAASKANRSQAALSTSVKELERILGQTLFDAGHKAKLTPFGEFCLPKINDFLARYDDLNSDLRSAAAGQLGQVRIASVPSVAAKLIPGILAHYTENHPTVEVALIDDNAAGVEARLLAGDVDLALGNCLHIQDERIEFTLLMTDPLGVVCLKDHPLATLNTPIDWQALQPYPFVKNGTCSLLEPTPANILAANALYSVENITSLFSVLELGVGITTLPKLAFPENAEHLCWLPLSSPYVERQIGIFRLRDRYISPQAYDFFELCISSLSTTTLSPSNL